MSIHHHFIQLCCKKSVIRVNSVPTICTYNLYLIFKIFLKTGGFLNFSLQGLSPSHPIHPRLNHSLQRYPPPPPCPWSKLVQWSQLQVVGNTSWHLENIHFREVLCGGLYLHMFWFAKNLSLTIPSSENMSFDVRNHPFSRSSDLRREGKRDQRR